MIQKKRVRYVLRDNDFRYYVLLRKKSSLLLTSQNDHIVQFLKKISVFVYKEIYCEMILVGI